MEFEAGTTTNIENMIFHQTCPACPEQYDVYKGSKVVAYVRLRHGRLTVECPEHGGERIHLEYIDDSSGSFASAERESYLTMIAQLIKQWHNTNKR